MSTPLEVSRPEAADAVPSAGRTSNGVNGLLFPHPIRSQIILEGLNLYGLNQTQTHGQTY